MSFACSGLLAAAPSLLCPLDPPLVASAGPDDDGSRRDGAPDRQGDLTLERQKKTQKPRRYKVIFHNDDYTTQVFVVAVLMRFFHKTETEATHIMLSVHHKGQGVAGVFPKDVAETKVDEVHDFAREHGMPLRLTAEPE